jgi:hypothetical protein
VGALFSPLPYQMIIAVGAGLSYMFFLNLLSLIFRHQWVAASVFIIVLTIILAPGYGIGSLIAAARPAFLLALVCYALTRFGVLTAVTLIYVRSLIQDFPLTTNGSAWYVHTAVFAIVSVLLIAVHGFHSTLGGRSLLPRHATRL